ncbi:MAG: hypothetical protein F4065_07875 [Rhodothermaceae bacterium]|nr:hypothetical protein [Rhodothermaceae bacterium]MXZ59136.1 hypothetical protein [Rhodothermaceae bacterium]MYB90285.1 hypothetical protein [Rhodothermaceae bacterium]MYD68539.1 hypothetical protein [Rhodothermaceae bacterium]MYG45670.1 hypothetical protein [Rhodothermaceae bacterium]
MLALLGKYQRRRKCLPPGIEITWLRDRLSGIGAMCVAPDLKHKERVPSLVARELASLREFRVCIEDEFGGADLQEGCDLLGN